MQKQSKNIVFHIAIFLLFATIISTCLASGMIAKYCTTTSGIDNVRVAIWDSSLSVSVPNELLENMKPGDTSTYTFTVSNQKEDGKVCETDQVYDIELSTAGNLPLTIELLENDKIIGSTEDASVNSKITVQATDMMFKASEVGEHTYTVKAAWNGNKSKIYASIPDYIEINVHAQQVGK